MSTVEAVIILLVAFALAAVRLFGIGRGLSSLSADLASYRASRKQWRTFRRLEKRDPAAAHAYGQQLEADLRREYESLRDRAETDSDAAREFVQRASEELTALRHLAADFQRKAAADPAAVTTASGLQAEIRRVELDLARAQRVRP